MTRILAIIATTCLTLAACGGTGDGGETTTSTATSAPGTTAAPSTTTTPVDESTSDSEPTALGESPAECTSPEGHSISYPSEWWANDGSVTDACGLFGPESIELEPATDVTAPINVFVDSVAFDLAAAPTETGGEIARAVTVVDGASAVRLVSRTGEGMLPEGTRVTSYIVDVATGGENRTMIMTTADVETHDYDRNVEVLDAMARTLDLDGETPSDLVASYEGGGAPFEVTATVGTRTVCLTVSPPGEEACLSAPNEESIVADTVGDVALGLAGPGVFQVRDTDGISYLPTAVAGSDARAWAIPIDGPTRLVAVDRSGEQLASAEVGN